MKAKPNLKIFAAVLLAAALAVLLFIGRRHTDYTYSEQNGFAMGTVVSQKLYGGTAEDAAAVANAVSDLEQLLSRHLDDSAVSALNRIRKTSARRSPFGVSAKVPIWCCRSSARRARVMCSAGRCRRVLTL